VIVFNEESLDMKNEPKFVIFENLHQIRWSNK